MSPAQALGMQPGGLPGDGKHVAPSPHFGFVSEQTVVQNQSLDPKLAVHAVPSVGQSAAAVAAVQ
jgi:hypothetical protein